ncbi:hypothetical protein SAMN05443575_2922 [Jatrophihabitans endophyticus]|uniref:Uncharacterized protein n=1 Tax=Jatrophihabitans endophyticus TaxID=1206085 RepID=A0A1M5N5E2_9ACTN|nr:hypothetical protein [Jatrophihabitans endophyticus]SHG84816.1 hypothetical protein SAMN05443575_2922 [Jatrophihabitans endophyticus]
MISLHPTRWRRRWPRRSLALLCTAAALLAGLAVVTSGGAASAVANSLRPGLGYRPAGEFVGYYLTRDGTKVYCLSPRRAAPSSVSLHTVSRYPGLGRASSAALAYAVRIWGDARSPRAAAVESQVLNTLAGNGTDVRRRNRHLPASLRRDVAAHVSRARAQRGPYTVRLSTPRAVLPGGRATGSVLVRSAAGRPVSGVRVRLTASRNAAVRGVVRTGRGGSARFRYAVTDVGEVRFGARASALPPTAVRVSHPHAGQQRMVSWAPTTAARASSSFRAAASGFSHRYGCTSECDGRPVTVLRACAPAARVASRLVYRVGGRRVVVPFAASGRRRCVSTTVTSADGDRVGATWQYRVGRHWSRAVAAGGTFVVDCPPAPAVGVTLAANCTRATVTIGLAQPGAGGSWTPLVNTSRHRMVLDVSGSRTARVYAATGHEAVWTTSARCGAKLHLGFRGGVLRGSGRYNYGPNSAVVTP